MKDSSSLRLHPFIKANHTSIQTIELINDFVINTHFPNKIIKAAKVVGV